MITNALYYVDRLLKDTRLHLLHLCALYTHNGSKCMQVHYNLYVITVYKYASATMAVLLPCRQHCEQFDGLPAVRGLAFLMHMILPAVGWC